MSMRVDHVTIAGSNLAALEQAFAGIGLRPSYGGPHSNGVTHMSLLSFADGSYVELISTLEPGAVSPLWHAAIAGDGGPCAWAVSVEDVAAEAARVAALGVPAKGPVAMTRRRADGLLVEWELAFLGDGEPGAMLPFLIKDRTPRAWRVPAETRVEEAGLTGVAMVVLGVAELAPAAETFQHVYGWPAPHADEAAGLGAVLAHFPGTPVALAAPSAGGGWLDWRLARFSLSPCAFLLGATDLHEAAARFPLVEPATWFGRPVAWFDPGQLRGLRLGLIGASIRSADTDSPAWPSARPGSGRRPRHPPPGDRPIG